MSAAPWSLRALVEDLRAGRTTTGAVWARFRERVAETDPALRAWVALADPPPAPGPGPLGGIPLGVKDIIDVAGLPTRCGAAVRSDASPAQADAAIVSAWRAAGALPAGKTVTTEFAFFAPGPTANPAAPGHTPGGSSSGSAAAVASGQVPLALGSQTAGSVTRPAAYCGVASLVMSHGRFPVAGVTGLSPSLDSHGVIACSVSDLALAWSALTGAPDLGALGGPPRILLWAADPLDVVEEPMRAALAAAVERLRTAGATVDTFPEERLVADVTRAHPVVMAFEAARERAAELARAGEISDQLALLLRTGDATSLVDYRAASEVVDVGEETVARLLSSYDVILGPAAPGPAPRGLDATGDPVLSRAWQAMGLPTVTVPGLADDHGLPLGVQLIGPGRGETDLIGHAAWVERHLTGSVRS
ncbi:Asp-tRNAAsn/Glu-tRNAGln amidotransferase A subunit [Nocardioides sp. YR527]|uniref:amidase family protein n=1 Tax=Nocardioides sp. YR527 TaxID=1881028 RepID=UPI00088AB726|nr:amidase [Nocardioides sp. YR527]SDK67711.1 Asp-tRNAAsn/Glu-tRNAGln amidotransferase A subunit [Nocardioides sp. YR527]